MEPQIIKYNPSPLVFYCNPSPVNNWIGSLDDVKRSLRRARAASAVVILLSIVYNAPQFAEREAYEETVCGGQGGEVLTRWRTRKTDVFGHSYYVVYKTICYFVHFRVS